MAKVLVGMVTCEIVLTNVWWESVDIWLMCNGNGVGSGVTIDQGSWCRCNCLVESQLIPIRKLCEKYKSKIIGLSKCSQTANCC